MATSFGVKRRELERALLAAEQSIALLDRCRPENAPAERARLLRALERGRPADPRWRYGRTGGLGELATGLARLSESAARAGPWGELYAARARELLLEARAAEVVGKPELRDLALARFRVGDDQDSRDALACATRWARLPAPTPCTARVPSEDDSDPSSLISRLRAAIGLRRLPFRVVVVDGLASASATGDGVIAVRAGDRHDEVTTRRIVLHEVLGHALPRFAARRERSALFALGTAGGSDDEEGRALLIEEREGCLDEGRRRELGLRHLAALGVQQGASWVDTARAMQQWGASVQEAVDLASRAHRGGGLAREVVYLPALFRVRRLLSDRPELERWLERGRIAVRLVPALEALGAPPELLHLPLAA